MNLITIIVFCFHPFCVFIDAYSDDVNLMSMSEISTYAHNTVRYNHAVQNLAWDEALGEEAEIYAKQLAAENSLHHSEGSMQGHFGENLYKGFDGFKKEKTVADAVFHW